MENKMEAQNEKKNLSAVQSVSSTKDVVSALLPQGYEQKINIRLIQASDIEQKPFYSPCSPRKGAGKDNKNALDLPPSFIGRLGDINKKVMAWLGQSEKNAGQFLHSPTAALLKAGVDLSREEQKHLIRNTEEIKSISFLPPGVLVTNIAAGAGKGKVEEFDNNSEKSEKEQSKDKDCGCS